MGDISTPDECFCGFLSLRKGTRFILYISAIRQLFHLLEYFGEPHSPTYTVVFIIFFTAAVIIIGLGIYGEKTEDSAYIKYFYYLLHFEAIVILIKILIVISVVGNEKAAFILIYLIFIGIQGYFIWVVKRYCKILEENVKQGSYQLPDEPPPFPV